MIGMGTPTPTPVIFLREPIVHRNDVEILLLNVGELMILRTRRVNRIGGDARLLRNIIAYWVVLVQRKIIT